MLFMDILTFFQVPLALGCFLITYSVSAVLYILLQGPIVMALDNLIAN